MLVVRGRQVKEGNRGQGHDANTFFTPKAMDLENGAEERAEFKRCKLKTCKTPSVKRHVLPRG